jgi:transketolase
MEQAPANDLTKLCRLVRYWILESTTEAGSGHPSSSLSAVELMVALFFGGILRADLKNSKNPANDRIIFSKGHASPLLYALYAASGIIDADALKTLRQFASPLEGHPTSRFSQIEAATGSLGQGLSIGLGMSLNAKYLDKLDYRTYVLLGDGELAEGSVWEAVGLASHYKLGNLTAIVDVNRLGQSGETMLGNNIEAYEKRFSAFGWKTVVVDGHKLSEIIEAYKFSQSQTLPTAIIAKTLKGNCAPIMEDQDGWHGKVLSKQQFREISGQFKDLNLSLRGEMLMPEMKKESNVQKSTGEKASATSYKKDDQISTRVAFGSALVRIADAFPNLIVLDADVKYSTFTEKFAQQYPERFFEMYIAEQNMVSAAVGISLRGKIVFVSTFAAFLTRAFDQIRMAQHSQVNLTFVGSHTGVSIGADGPSQMGLEDIAMFRTIHGSVVLYPSDALSCEKLVEEAAKTNGIVYLRTTRSATPVIYENQESFPVGGSKTLKADNSDQLTIISAGITLHEALKAHELLKAQDISTRIIDLYSIKPLDTQTLVKASQETKALLVVEDHHPEGGMAEAVRSALHAKAVPVYSLSVSRKEMSGRPEDLLDYEDISAEDIVRKVKLILKPNKK